MLLSAVTTVQSGNSHHYLMVTYLPTMFNEHVFTYSTRQRQNIYSVYVCSATNSIHAKQCPMRDLQGDLQTDKESRWQQLG